MTVNLRRVTQVLNQQVFERNHRVIVRKGVATELENELIGVSSVRHFNQETNM